MYSFNSQITSVGSFSSNWSQDEIKNEPMLFNCNLAFAELHGGPITRAFLDAMPTDWKDVVVDSRIHMLMPGWRPAIPGYHHDDVPRGIDGQPNYDNPEYYSEHLMGLVNGDICPTNFALGQCTMPDKVGELIYREWHLEVELLLKEGKLISYNCPSGEILHFDWQTFHCCTAAINSGWRWFIRVSRNTLRTKNITNELRNQVQVYLEFPMEGW